MTERDKGGNKWFREVQVRAEPEHICSEAGKGHGAKDKDGEINYLIPSSSHPLISFHCLPLSKLN